MNIFRRLLILNHGVMFLLSIGAFIAGFGATPAQAINWDIVDGQDVVLFHPGQAVWEWVLTQSDHSGAHKFRKGKECRDCHEGEQADIGILMASGEKAEPDPIEGNVGHVSVNIKFSRDDTKLYTRFEWLAPAVTSGQKMDPEFESKITMMFADDAVKEAERAGCWGTCHDDALSMPSAGDMKLTKYLAKSRTKLTRQGGGNSYKTDEELSELMKSGEFMEYWQVRLNPGSPASLIDGHILKAREVDKDPMVQGEASFADGKWTVVMSRALKSESPEHHNLVEGKTYYVGFALHDNYKIQRFHNVSFKYTFVLDQGEADFVALKQ